MTETFSVTANHAYGGESRPFDHFALALLYAYRLAERGYENIKIWNGRGKIIRDISIELAE